MQTIGSLCSKCNQCVAFEREGTWCSHCRAIFHKNCIEKEAIMCRNCNQKWVDPATFFTYSESCPKCGVFNKGKESICEICEISMQWDTKEEYVAFCKETQRSGRVMLIGGLINILLLLGLIALLFLPAAYALLILIFYPITAIYFFPLALFLLIAIVKWILSVLSSIQRGIELIRFR